MNYLPSSREKAFDVEDAVVVVVLVLATLSANARSLLASCREDQSFDSKKIKLEWKTYREVSEEMSFSGKVA